MRRLLQFCCDNNLTFTIRPDRKVPGKVHFRFETGSRKCCQRVIEDSEIPNCGYQYEQLEDTLIRMVENAFIEMHPAQVVITGGDSYENY